MKRACLCTEKSGSNLIEEIWCVRKMFKQSKKIKKSKKLIDEVQKENKTEKTMECNFMPDPAEKWVVHRKE